MIYKAPPGTSEPLEEEPEVVASAPPTADIEQEAAAREARAEQVTEREAPPEPERELAPEPALEPAPTPPPEVPQPTAEGAPEVVDAPLLVSKTSGEDAFVVRRQIKDRPEGEYFQETMTEQQVVAAGGRIPTATETAVVRESGQPVPPPPARELTDIEQEAAARKARAEQLADISEPSMPFVIPPDAKPVESNVKGEVITYETPDGIRHYTPVSAMWGLGYKTSTEYAGGQGKPLYINIKTDADENIHITNEQASGYQRLSPKEQFDTLVKWGVVDKGAKFIQGTGGLWDYVSGKEMDRLAQAELIAEFTAGAEIQAWNNKIASLGDYYDKDTNKIDVYGAVKAGRAGLLRELNIDNELIKAIEDDIAEEAKYTDWSARELTEGKTDMAGVYEPSPYGVKDNVYNPYPVWAGAKIYDAVVDAQDELRPYKVVQETGRTLATPEGDVKETVEFYDISRAIEQFVPENTLKQAGFTDEDIQGAKEYMAKKDEYDAQLAKLNDITNRLDTYKSVDVTPSAELYGGELRISYDIGKAVNEGNVTKDELQELGYEGKDIDRSIRENELGIKATLFPIAMWAHLTTAEKIMSVGELVLFVIPGIGVVGKMGSMQLRLLAAASKVGIAPKLGFWSGRMGTALKSAGYLTEEFALAPIKFPLQVIRTPSKALKGLWEVSKFPFRHPIETTKGWQAVITGKVYTGTPSAIKGLQIIAGRVVPRAVMGTPAAKGTGVERLFISEGLTPTEAVDATKKMQIYVYTTFQSGMPVPEKINIPVYRDGKLFRTIEFPMARAAREAGIAIHSTPFAERIMAGAAEPIAGERPLYFSTGESPIWTSRSAHGEFVEEIASAGRAGAI
ncbi:hypothetical protein LCGC14_1486730, partial [marine sediment metagenome]